VSRIRLLRTASFRLAVLYLALFTASALALGAFVYMSVQREILADFDERIVEETGALKSDFAAGGRERLAGIIQARGSGGAGFSYGLAGPDGRPIAGRRRRKPAAKSQPNPSRRSYVRSPHRLPTARPSSSATSGGARIRS
jgi:hypothetical protein